MEIEDVDILMLPGLEGGSSQHWYMLWKSENLLLTSRVEVSDWFNPHRDEYVDAVTAKIAERSNRPIILIGHSLGTMALVQGAEAWRNTSVCGVVLIGVPDLSQHDLFEHTKSYLPTPSSPLPFPSVVIASRTDEFCTYDVAARYASAWGSNLEDIGDSGHINPDSGHGPWPEGLDLIKAFISRL